MRGPIRSVLLAAFAALGCTLAVGASSAMALQLETGGAVSLRDNLLTPPSNGQYGADLLANNTAGPLALTTAPTETVANKNPQFDAFVGLKLNSNPAATTTSVAVGYVEFADFQNATAGTGATASPVYADTLVNPWRVEVNGAKNAAPNVVTISGVGLYFPVLADEARGTLAGLYEQPGANCAAGGVKLNLKQPGLLVNGANVEAGVDNGTAGKNAFLCFVSSNNYVFPTTPTGLGALTGSVKNN